MIVPDSPFEISSVIPQKFSRWRGPDKEQKEAVKFIIDSNEKYNILEIPTGYGKSLIAVSVAALSEKKTYIIVPNTHLVEQYLKEFNIHGIMGRKNYQCTLFPTKRASECPFEFNISKCPVIRETLEIAGVKSVSDLYCDEIPCPYIQARCYASKSDIVVMTYDYFYYAVIKSKILPKPKILIVDEAHLFTEKFPLWFSWKAKISNISFANSMLKEQSTQSLIAAFQKNKNIAKNIRSIMRKKYGKYVSDLEQLPDDVLCPEDIVGTFEKISEIVDMMKKTLTDMIIETSMDDDFDVSLVENILDGSNPGIVTTILPSSLKYKVEKFIRAYSMLKPYKEMYHILKDSSLFYPSGKKYRYIVYKKEDEIIIKSIVPQLDFEEIEKETDAEKYIFMSATIVPKYLAHELGIYSSYSSMTLEPLTPVEARKVFFYPYAKLYRDSLDQNLFIRDYINKVIDKTLHNFSTERGIIMVSAKKDIEALMKYSKEKKRFIVFSGSAEEKLMAIEELKRSKNGVLLSTGWEGVDLPDELSRFQIIYQVPFPYMGDPYIIARRKIDPKWYILTALNKIVQGCGRSVRHENDFSVTYIFDQRFEGLIKRYSSFLPRWFVDSIEKTNSLDYALSKGRNIIKKLSL